MKSKGDAARKRNHAFKGSKNVSGLIEDSRDDKAIPPRTGSLGKVNEFTRNKP